MSTELPLQKSVEFYAIPAIGCAEALIGPKAEMKSLGEEIFRYIGDSRRNN